MKKKSVLITGASSGIGFELALNFVLRENFEVIAFARNADLLEKLREKTPVTLRANLHIVAGDLTRDEDLKRLFENVKSLAGGLDILINNAGMLKNKKFMELSSSDWESIYNTNVFGLVSLIRVIHPLMVRSREDDRSHIVNIASMGGVQGSVKFAGLSAYSSAKAAVAGLSECLAEEFRSDRISVNCLALGSVQTTMFREAFPNIDAAMSPSEMASYIAEFARSGHHFFNGKILPVSVSTP